MAKNIMSGLEISQRLGAVAEVFELVNLTKEGFEQLEELSELGSDFNYNEADRWEINIQE
jgi:hypothetical protein